MDVEFVGALEPFCPFWALDPQVSLMAAARQIGLHNAKVEMNKIPRHGHRS